MKAAVNETRKQRKLLSDLRVGYSCGILLKARESVLSHCTCEQKYLENMCMYVFTNFFLSH